jgi:hypothetical protein
MPILLDVPVSGPVAVRAEIRKHEVDRDDGVVRMTFASYDADGNELSRQQVTSALFTPQGALRVSGALYVEIKSALYAIAIEDGHVAGVVE